MNKTLRKTINEILITDIENGITEKNKHYFYFAQDLPECLHSKKILLQLSLMIGFFISTLFINKSEILYVCMTVLTALICTWYLYDSRYIHYYRKAAYAFLLDKNEKGWKYLNKILAARRIYIEGMPPAYNILKAKQMLINNDFQAGEYLAENALKQIKGCPEAKVIRGICEYEKGNLKKAVELISSVCVNNFCLIHNLSTEELIGAMMRDNENKL